MVQGDTQEAISMQTTIGNLEPCEEAGDDFVSFLIPGGMPRKENVRSLELFCERVIPPFSRREGRG
jgi:hypothetical protein